MSKIVDIVYKLLTTRNKPSVEKLHRKVYRKDPWHRREAWRYDEFFSSKETMKAFFPGLSIALSLFALILIAEKLGYIDPHDGLKLKKDHNH